MFINKYSLLAKKIMASEEEKGAKPAICYLLVKKDKVIATDAKVLIEIENPKEEKYGNVQDAADKGIKSTDKDILLDKDDVSMIEKNIKKKPTYPIPKVLIGEENGTVQVVIPTEKEPNILMIKQKISAKTYPNTEIYPKGKAKFSVILSVRLLQKVLSVVSRLSTNRWNDDIKFTFYGEAKGGWAYPVKFEFKNPDTANVKGAIMPKEKC